MIRIEGLQPGRCRDGGGESGAAAAREGEGGESGFARWPGRGFRLACDGLVEQDQVNLGAGCGGRCR